MLSHFWLFPDTYFVFFFSCFTARHKRGLPESTAEPVWWRGLKTVMEETQVQRHAFFALHFTVILENVNFLANLDLPFPCQSPAAVCSPALCVPLSAALLGSSKGTNSVYPEKLTLQGEMGSHMLVKGSASLCNVSNKTNKNVLL